MPMSSAEWTEYWYPYSDIGIVNGVSADAALNVSIEAVDDNQSVANIKLFANRNLKDLSIVLCRGTEKLKAVPLPSLVLGKPETVSVTLNCNLNECDTIAVVVVDSANAVIVNALPEAVRKQPVDSYFIPKILPENKAEDFTAEGIFSKAEILLKDWLDHLPEIKRLLNAALKVDPGFSRAHIELGMICLKGGQFETALEHFDRALTRIVDDGRTIYYKGLTLWLLGRAKEARAVLRRSSRFGYECQERVMEAIIAINQHEEKDAYEQLKQAERTGDGVLLIKVLKAIILYRAGRNVEAQSVASEAEKITSDNPFIYCVHYLLSDHSTEVKNQTRNIYSGLQSEILEVIAVLNFAGLNSEAYALFDLIDASNDIVELYRTHLERVLEIDAATNIPSIGGVADFAWRLEEFMLLQQAINLAPEKAENYFHLGNFSYGHGFTSEGIKAWKLAAEKGLSSPILSYQLFRAHKQQGEIDKANQYISEAFVLDNSDPYIFDDYAEMVFTKEGTEAGIRFLEDNLSTTMKYFTSMQKLLSSYIEVGNYDKMQDLLMKVDFSCFWRSSLGSFWLLLKQAKGYLALQEKDYVIALEHFSESADVPGNISLNYLPRLTVQARNLFYSGICHAELGDNDAAEKCWTAMLELNLKLRFEYSAKFEMCCTRFFQVFALKALKRYPEADMCMQVIRESAFNPKFQATAQKSLLKLGNMAEQYDYTEFDKFDTPAGLASNLSMATSVED